MKKKIIALCLIVALAATAVIGGTLAYFTDTKTATNTFTVGNVTIELTEPNWVASGSVDAPQAYPGEALAKDPTVKNTGANPCFVRIKVSGLGCLGEGNTITIEGVSTDWTRVGDVFYYNGVLDAGQKTDAAFQRIRIPKTVTNGFDGDYDVVVTAEAVQAQGARPSFTAVQAMTVTEIAAWFDTCMPSGTGA